jgi:hypothetical protein
MPPVRPVAGVDYAILQPILPLNVRRGDDDVYLTRLPPYYLLLSVQDSTTMLLLMIWVICRTAATIVRHIIGV